MRHSIFPLMDCLLSFCCDAPSTIKMLDFCCQFIQDLSAENIKCQSAEMNALQLLALKTKNLFDFWYWDKQKFVVCDKLIKIWGILLSSSSSLDVSDEWFAFLIQNECHILCFNSLPRICIKNAPILFNIMMEKMCHYEMETKKNETECQKILRDIAQSKYCKILMKINNQWIDDDDDDTAESAFRIGHILDGLKHLICINQSTLNAQLFGLQSSENSNYPLFLHSVLKLSTKWKSSSFEIDDIKNLMIILNLAHNNGKWTRTMNKNKAQKSNEIRNLFRILFNIINNEEDIDEKREAAEIFTKLKQKML